MSPLSINNKLTCKHLELRQPSQKKRLMSNIGTKFVLATRFVFDPNNNSLMDQQSEDEVVRLGSNESRILLMLCERPNEVITRHELHEFVWREQGFQVDDSSLTQAISTLRKMLKDSTKSPQFVKTVPKRGYMLISSVEKAIPLSSSTPTAAMSEADGLESTPLENDEASSTPSAVNASPAQTDTKEQPKSKPMSKETLIGRVLALCALALPIMVYLLTAPSEGNFKHLATYGDTPVLMPESHPNLTRWLPHIERCILQYQAHHADELKPTKVIATGGQGQQLVLNYIHAAEYSTENVTVQFYFEQTELTQICK